MRGNEKVKVDRVELDPFATIRQRVVNQMLQTTNGFLDEVLAAQLRTALELPQAPAAAPAPVATPSTGGTTNAPAGGPRP